MAQSEPQSEICSSPGVCVDQMELVLRLKGFLTREYRVKRRKSRIIDVVGVISRSSRYVVRIWVAQRKLGCTASTRSVSEWVIRYQTTKTRLPKVDQFFLVNRQLVICAFISSGTMNSADKVIAKVGGVEDKRRISLPTGGATVASANKYWYLE
jgi:hypothetical protein